MKSYFLANAVRILFLFFLIICGLYFAKPFLVPVAFAGIFAMLFLSAGKFFEGKGINRALSSLLCILILVGLIAAVFALLSWQVSDLAKDMGQAKERMTNMADQLRQYISNTLGISAEKQQEMIKKQQSSGSGDAATTVKTIMSTIMGFAVDFILVIVYMFLFLYFRTHLKKFILKLVPDEDQKNTTVIINKSTKVAQQYVGGLAMMIVILWIMYGIGFSIVGVKNAIFFAMLCGLLEIVPFIGNLTGTALTLIMALSQGGGSGMVIGILITYGTVQFIQTYLLEPLVVGAEVKINPLFTIIGLVAGELIWGIPGMVLAIPILGIIKIICDHVPVLQPYGFLIGEQKKKKSPGFLDKIKKKFS